MALLFDLAIRGWFKLIKTVAYEFFSRGLIWGRVLLIGFLIPESEYGHLILLITAETLLGTVASYPQTKEVLLRHDVDRRHIAGTLMFLGALSPVVFLTGYWYFGSLLEAGVVFISGAFFATFNVSLYVYRISNIRAFNNLKILSAIGSTAVFFLALPVNPNYLPLVSGSSLLILAIWMLSARDFEILKGKAQIEIREVVVGWLIFGGQSTMTMLSQYGTRFLIGATLSLADVAIYTKSYMLASGVTFYYAAIMAHYEKDLAKISSLDMIHTRFPLAQRVLGMLACGVVLYAGLILTLWKFPVFESIARLSGQLDFVVFLLFILFFILQALYLILNPMVIAIGGRGISVLSSAVSIFTQIIALALFWQMLSLKSVAFAALGGQLALIVVLFLQISKARRAGVS